MFAVDALGQAVGPGDEWGLLCDPLAMALVQGISDMGKRKKKKKKEQSSL